MESFYWLIPRVLAGCGRPGPHGRRPHGDLVCDLAWLHGQGIRAVLSLTEEPLDPAPMEQLALSSLHLPVDDFTPPTPDQLLEALAFIDEHRAADRAVVVHCLAGQGRTGTVLAAYLVRSGRSPKRAISELRQVCPHAVENALQEAAVADFARRREWIA